MITWCFNSLFSNSIAIFFSYFSDFKCFFTVEATCQMQMDWTIWKWDSFWVWAFNMHSKNSMLLIDSTFGDTLSDIWYVSGKTKDDSCRNSRLCWLPADPPRPIHTPPPPVLALPKNHTTWGITVMPPTVFKWLNTLLLYDANGFLVFHFKAG